MEKNKGKEGKQTEAKTKILLCVQEDRCCTKAFTEADALMFQPKKHTYEKVPCLSQCGLHFVLTVYLI